MRGPYEKSLKLSEENHINLQIHCDLKAMLYYIFYETGCLQKYTF